MTLLILILINILIINVWLWISETAFDKTVSIKQKILYSVLGIVVGVILWLYPQTVSLLQSDVIGVFKPGSISIENTGSLIVYCLLFLAIGLWIFRKKPSKKEIIGITGAVIITLATVLFGIHGGLSSIALYYLGVAFSEELLKYFSGSFASKNSILETDMILWTIIVALGFSFIENIFYAFSVRESFIHSLAVLTNRGAIGFLMHSVFTGSITLIAIKTIKNNKKRLHPLAVFLGLIAGISIHLLYNVAIEFNYTLLIILLIISGYGTLSYLLYSSDRLYIESIE